MTTHPVLKVIENASPPTICHDPDLRHFDTPLVTPCRRKLVVVSDQDRLGTIRHQLQVRQTVYIPFQFKEGVNILSYCSKYLSYLESEESSPQGHTFGIVGAPDGAELSFSFKSTYRSMDEFSWFFSREYPLTIERRCVWAVTLKEKKGVPTLKQQGIVNYLGSRSIYGLPLTQQRNLKDFTESHIPESIKSINWINVELHSQGPNTIFPVPRVFEIFPENPLETSDSDDDSYSAQD